MKKFWFEIILVILGIILLCSTGSSNIAFLKGMGGGALLVAIIWFIIHLTMIKKKKETENQGFPIKQHNNEGNAFPTKKRQDIYTSLDTEQKKQQPFSSNKQESTSASPPKKEEERIRILNTQISLLHTHISTQILDYDDIRYLAEISLNSKDIYYIAENLNCPRFGSDISIKSIMERMETMNFSDDETITLLKYGSSHLRERLSRSCTNISWNIPLRVFEYLVDFDRMFLLTLTYSESMFTKLLDKMNPYELLGYRIEQKQNEAKQGTLTTFMDEEIPYYEDLDTDVVYIIEQNFPSNDDLRKHAFDKVFTGPCDLTEIIGRVDNLTEYEVKKIFERGNEAEIEKMFDRNDSDDLVDYLPPKYAIKVVLGLIPSEYSEFIHDSFNFENVDDTIWLEIFEELTPDELSGYRINKIEEDEEELGTLTEDEKKDIPYYAEGDHDIMNLIQDHAGDDDDLRIAALQKVIHARCVKDIIESLNTITDNEAKLIMESGYEDAIEALLERSDSDDIIGNLPEDMAIKIMLGLIYSDASDNVKNNYSFNNSGAFMKVIEELSPYQLLGYILTSEETDSSITDLEKDKELYIASDADYDIIRLIEEEMNGDIHLRTLAFNKICQGKNMVDAIVRWENLTDTEVAKIIERGFNKEIDALVDREDFPDFQSKVQQIVIN